jgi:hypothetical protein
MLAILKALAFPMAYVDSSRVKFSYIFNIGSRSGGPPLKQQQTFGTSALLQLLQAQGS